jgi:hypothetical protein
MESNIMANDLSQRRNLSNSYAAKKSSNTFGRSRARRDFSRQRADATKNFQRQTPRVTSNYASRGLGNSGVYKRALQRFTGDYGDQMGRIDQNYQDMERQYTMQDAGYRAEYDAAIGRLDLEKKQRIADTAAGINGLRPLIG